MIDIQPEDINDLALKLRLPYPLLASAIEVEAKKDALVTLVDPITGKQITHAPLLVERHKVWKWLATHYGQAYADEEMVAHPDIVNRKPGGYTRRYQTELERFVKIEKRYGLDCAIWSTSLGFAQIMGFNWKDTGAKSLQDFYSRMNRSLKDQLELFTTFMTNYRGGKALTALRNYQLPAYARMYNGKNHAKNRYVPKMIEAYIRHGGSLSDLKKRKRDSTTMAASTLGALSTGVDALTATSSGVPPENSIPASTVQDSAALEAQMHNINNMVGVIQAGVDNIKQLLMTLGISSGTLSLIALCVLIYIFLRRERDLEVYER